MTTVEPMRVLARPLEELELSRVGILSNVSMEAIWGILSQCPVIEAEPGHTVISPDSAERTLYLLLEGSLRVYLEQPSAARMNRESRPSAVGSVAELGPGQVVGEISVLEARPATAYVVTATRARLVAVSEATFWRLVQASHEFSINLLLLLAHRMRENNRQLSSAFAQHRVLKRDVTTDALTGLLNRRWLEQSLPRIVERHRRSAQALSVLMVDIDHFKRVNDQHGHATGDAVLAFTARTLLGTLRPTDLCARYGGEEMTVILPGAGLAGALAAAERVRRAVEHPASSAASPVPVTISVGVATLEPGDDVAALLSRADERLYCAKSRGRNRVEV